MTTGDPFVERPAPESESVPTPSQGVLDVGRDEFFPKAVLILLCLLSFLIASQRISLFGGGIDLGRLLRDGDLILHGPAEQVLKTNFYSYSEPDHPFVNHHWLAAILFSQVWKATGFYGLHLFYIALGIAAFLLFYSIAERAASFLIAGPLAGILMLLMHPRPSVRPEVFTLLFAGLFLTILWRNHNNISDLRWLWALPFIQALWVNMHPGFVFGPGLIGAFLVCDLSAWWLRPRGPSPAERRQALTLFATLAAVALACLLNPNGVRGAIFPFTVPLNYGLAVEENESLFRLHQRPGTNLLAGVIDIAILILLASMFWAWRRRQEIQWPLWLISLTMLGLTCMIHRFFPLLGLFTLVTACVNFGGRRLGDTKGSEEPGAAAPSIGLPAVGLASAGAVLVSGVVLLSISNRFGLGLVPNQDDLAQFLRKNQITGRMFNNYNGGGYLIHYMPELRVFVDSRPEAYSSSFLQEQYTRPLADNDLWRPLQDTWNFDFLCFVGAPPWQVKAALSHAFEPEWALVFAGKGGLVIVRRIPRFAELIQKYEIPVDQHPAI